MGLANTAQAVDSRRSRTAVLVSHHARGDAHVLTSLTLMHHQQVEKVPDSTYDMIGGCDQQIKEIKEASGRV